MEQEIQETEEYVDLSDEVEDAIQTDIQSGDNVHQVTMIDAASESAKVLVPQMGTDTNLLREGKYDVRRFSDIREVDVVWLTWFSNIPEQYGGGYAKAFCNAYLNHRYSVDGKNKKLVVQMQQAVSGSRTRKEAKDERSWIQRNITRRNQAPSTDDDLYDVG